MKIYGKLAILLAVMIFLPSIVAAATDADTGASPHATAAPGSDAAPPPADQPKPPGLQDMLGNFDFLRIDALKDERDRHEKAVADIMAPVKALQDKLVADIKALRDEYFPQPAEGQEAAAPTQEKIQEYMDKIKALVEKAQTDNEPALRDAAGKLFDEFMTHFDNVLKIVKDNKDAIVTSNWNKLLLLPTAAGGFGGGMHNGHWRGQPGAAPAPGANAQPAMPQITIPLELMGRFDILQSSAFKDEMARHIKAVEDATAALKPIREKLIESIKALRDQCFPRPAEGEEPTPPTADQIKDFTDKLKALFEQAQTDNKATLQDVAGKLFDEFMTHFDNVLKIAKDNKDAVVNENWKKLLLPPDFRGLFGRWRHRMHGEPTPAPAPPAPPAGE